MERWRELLLGGPAEVRDELLTKCSGSSCGEIPACRNAGAGVLLCSNPFGTAGLVSMKLLEERAIPWIERDLRPSGVRGVVYYGGGVRLNPVLDRVLERAGIGT